MRWALQNLAGVSPTGAELAIMNAAGLPAGIQAYLLASVRAFTTQYGPETTLDLSASGCLVDSGDTQGSASVSIAASGGV